MNGKNDAGSCWVYVARWVRACGLGTLFPISRDIQVIAKHSVGFIGKHWKGEYSLTTSFWVIFVLLTAAYHYLETFLQHSFVDRPAVFISVTIVYLIISRLIVLPWQIVGLLRAADKHYLAYERAIIRYGVQATIVASLALTAAHLIGSAQSLVSYKEKTDFEANRGKTDYTLNVVNQGGFLRVQGPLDIGITRAVENMLDGHPQIRAIILDSDGGQIYEGRGLAILFDERGLDTYSFSGCSSACSTAFVGGINRFLGTKAKLGFHQYRLDSDTILQFYKFYDLDIEQRKDLDLYQAKNINNEFLKKIFETPHDRMWFPNVQTLIDAGVIHGVVDEQDILSIR